MSRRRLTIPAQFGIRRRDRPNPTDSRSAVCYAPHTPGAHWGKIGSRRPEITCHDRRHDRPSHLLPRFRRRHRCRQRPGGAIKPLAAATRRPGADADLGGFGALFDLKARGLQATRSWSPPPTASAPSSRSPSRPAGTTPSASTSSPCASTTSLAQGAEPLFFLDYFAMRQARRRGRAHGRSPASPTAAGRPAAP